MRVALRVVGELLLLGSVVLRSLFERVVREVVDVVRGDSSWQTWFASLELSTTLAPVKPWEWFAGTAEGWSRVSRGRPRAASALDALV